MVSQFPSDSEMWSFENVQELRFLFHSFLENSGSVVPLLRITDGLDSYGNCMTFSRCKIPLSMSEELDECMTLYKRPRPLLLAGSETIYNSSAVLRIRCITGVKEASSFTCSWQWAAAFSLVSTRNSQYVFLKYFFRLGWFLCIGSSSEVELAVCLPDSFSYHCLCLILEVKVQSKFKVYLLKLFVFTNSEGWVI